MYVRAHARPMRIVPVLDEPFERLLLFAGGTPTLSRYTRWNLGLS